MADTRYDEYLKIDNEFWKLQYIGRKVNDLYYSVFDKNGYYPSDDYNKYPEYDENGIVINIRLDITNDDVVTDIDYYKVVDHGIYYKGSDDRPITAHDIKVFKNVLDVCTVSEAPDIFKTLADLPLKEGWRIRKISDKSVSIANSDGSISVPKEYVYSVIDIARNVPDIRDNKDFWDINKKHLKLKYKDAVFALLYNFTKEHFPEVALGETANERIAREDREEAAKKELIKAISKNQADKLSELTKAIPEIPHYAIETAVNKKRKEFLKTFIPKVSHTTDLVYIGNYAISAGETDLLTLVVNKGDRGTNSLIYTAYNYHRLDYVTMLLEKGYTLHIRPDNKTNYELDQIIALTDYREVYFPASTLEKLYQVYGAEPIKKIVYNYHPSNRNFIKDDPDGYYEDERMALVRWLIEKQDIDLIDLAANNGVRIGISQYGYDRAEDLAVRLFEIGGDLWEHGRLLFSGNITYSRCFNNKNLEMLEFLAQHVSVTKKDFQKAIEAHVDNEMIRAVVQHLDLSIPVELTPGKPDTWYYGLKIQDLSAYELFFSKYNEFIADEKERQSIYDHFMWHYHDPERAKILVKCCNYPEIMIKEAVLSSQITQSRALTLVEKEYNRDKEKQEKILPHKVLISYYDDCSWEVKGKPSRSKWDMPNVEDLHYLVSMRGEVPTITNCNNK